MGINRNKRSIVIDLKNEDGVNLAKHMLKDADVTVQNSRPGAMERIGLGYEDVKAFNPGIIYCTVSGFGTTGPYSHKAGRNVWYRRRRWAFRL